MILKNLGRRPWIIAIGFVLAYITYSTFVGFGIVDNFRSSSVERFLEIDRINASQ